MNYPQTHCPFCSSQLTKTAYASDFELTCENINDCNSKYSVFIDIAGNVNFIEFGIEKYWLEIGYVRSKGIFKKELFNKVVLNGDYFAEYILLWNSEASLELDFSDISSILNKFKLLETFGN